MSLLILKYPTPKRLRIIDGLVAEHLMGWKWFSAVDSAFLVPPWGFKQAKAFRAHWTEGLFSLRTDGRKFRCKQRYDIELVYNDTYRNWELPRYSKESGAAFEVIEVMAQQWISVSIRFRIFYKPPWLVEHRAAADTLPLAVCLAVLDLLNIQFPWLQKPKRPKASA